LDNWVENRRNLELPAEVVERISYMIGIYKALRTLYPSRERADAWVKKTNRAYGGRTPLEVMLDGNLAQVRKHLDAECV
jgi:antitoxin Xre/MbcA/ParS-like protein